MLMILTVMLLLGGGGAVTIGILGQDAAPAPAAATQPRPSTPGPTPTSAAASPPPDAPQRAAPGPPPVAVSVPAIGVRSELLSLGLDADGALAVPQPGPDYDKAAWFTGSPRPGDIGPAVIEGHVDSAATGPSVFYELGRLMPGDRIEVTRADGSVVPFVVYDVRVVPKDDFPTLDVYGNTPGPELRLITCGGPFDGEARSYQDNVVVFARAAT
jgi:hypothetical protein